MCIFCKIITGEVESSKVYEDNDILAFMDLHPVNDGQVLVIPKIHIDHFSDITHDLAMKIYAKTHDISQSIRRVINPERVGLVVHGYGVPHAHMVIVPQNNENDIMTEKMINLIDGKILIDMSRIPAASRETLDSVAYNIKQGMN